MILLVWVHTFPAQRHIGLFLDEPSLTEAWKGFGALAAVVFYLLTPATVGRLLALLWRARLRPLTWMGLVLAVAHLVPVTDHLPRFVQTMSWGDAWRGFGALTAAVWFVAPLPIQARALRCIARLVARRPATSPINV